MPKADKWANARQGLVAVACGLLSAGFVMSAETSSLFRLLLVGLSPLPLFAVGFWAGPLTCLTAGLTATVIVTVAMGSVAGAPFLGGAAIPAAARRRRSKRRCGLT